MPYRKYVQKTAIYLPNWGGGFVVYINSAARQ